MSSFRDNLWWLSFIAPGTIIVLVARWLTHVNLASGFELTMLAFVLNVLLYGTMFCIMLAIIAVAHVIQGFRRMIFWQFKQILSDWRILIGLGATCSILAVFVGIFLASAIEKDFGRRTAREAANYLFSAGGEEVLPRQNLAEPLQAILAGLNSWQPEVWPLDNRTRQSGVLSGVSTSERDLICGRLFGSCNVRVRVYSRHPDHAVEGMPIEWHGHGDSPQLFLSPACRLYRKQEQAHDILEDRWHVRLVEGPGVWVSLGEAAAQVELLDAQSSPCAKKFSEQVCAVSGMRCQDAVKRVGAENLEEVEKAICESWENKCSQADLVDKELPREEASGNKRGKR